MKSSLAQQLRSWSLITIMVFALHPTAHAAAASVRYVQGAFHGFLEMYSEDGKVVASGDSTQVVHGDRVTSRTLFRFKDGSVDEEITVFSQHHTFQLITYHHIQKGPSFPHPIDMTIDVHSGQVTVRTTGKDGKENVDTEHMNLPLDLANGMVPLVIGNMQPNLPGTTVSMVVTTPKPRLVKLDISPAGEVNPLVAGSSQKAMQYEIKIELGGLVGVIAPFIGKAPPNIQFWVIRGEAPTFAKEHGPLYAEGPMMTIQLASPVWPGSQKPGY
jgi:hypothetical protein